LPTGPRQADGSLAFTSGVCIYLPPGYATSDRRYPSLYLLHGGGGDQGNWIAFGDVQKTMDDAYARDHRNALIVISPDGTSGQWYDAIDGSLRNEEYVLRWVVPYIDRHYRTIVDRRARAIDGLSNGGYGAMHLAAKAPDLFSIAGAMSANLGGRGFDGWGDAQDDPAYGHGQTPADLAGNLDDVDLTFDWGATCVSDVTVDLCATWAFEQSFRLDNQYFQGQLKTVNHRGENEYRENEGGHAWRWWSMWLRERHLPFILARITRPVTTPAAPPTTFRYRSIAPSFSVYGYTVTVTRDVREFLDLTDVRADALTLTGSGRAVVRTAALYPPGRSYMVDSRTTVADAEGRLTFPVDLGPSHTAEQYGTQAMASEAAGNYWTTRTVRIAPAGTGAVAVAASHEVLPVTGRDSRSAAVGALALALVVTRRRFARR
jgi:S-formylglutathione hydrolase FrmB